MDARRPELVMSAVQRFCRLVEDLDVSPVPPQLDEIALAISSVIQPGLDEELWLHALDDLASTCPAASRDAIVAHLFASGRLSGDAVTYESWRNSCLDQVLRSGRGIPITLSVVAIEVGRRLGVPLVGIGMPGHFLVGDATDDSWHLDGFNGGRVLGRTACRALYERITGNEAGWLDAYLDPTPPHAIVARMLTNLANVFRTTDHVRLALVTRMRMAVPGLPGTLGDTDPRRVLSSFN